MSTTTQYPTPETDAAIRKTWPADAVALAIKLERERNEARAIVSACMSAMPIGNIQTHTPENLAARIGDLASALAAETSENEAMREAIKEAHDTIKDATDNCLWRSDSPIPLSAEQSQRLYNRAIETMENLQPFLP